MNSKSLSGLLNSISTALLPACGNSVLAEQESWWILEYVLSKSRSAILLCEYIDLLPDQKKIIDSCIDQRVIQKKPLAYILGQVPFCDVNILVRPPILIPRLETEEWVCWFISLIKKCGIQQFSMLDLCCGSGCIGLAVAKTFPASKVLGIDVFDEAIKLCNENKIHNNINNIEFLQSNLFDGLSQDFKCDFIVSNPPYLSAGEYSELDVDVKIWEDKNALVADNFGMKFYKEILLNARKYFNRISVDIPQIVLEIGPAQDSIERLIEELGYKYFKIYNDMQGKRRWIVVYF